MVKSSRASGKNSSRNSSIELLKIVAMFLIVMFHINMSLSKLNVLPLSYDENSGMLPTCFIIHLLNFLGPIGNMIFWVCSCWFLVSSDKMSCRKVFFIMADIWIISMLILIPSILCIGVETIGIKKIIFCFFPTFFANNWYLTCYLLVFAIHPLLNLIILKFDHKSYFRFTLSLIFLYCFTNLVRGYMFFSSYLIVFIVVYFIIGYMKLYGRNFCNNCRLNFFLLAISICAIICYCVIELLQFPGLPDWHMNENPFVLFIAITSLNLALQRTFCNKFINYISGLTLFIYIIHENLIVRSLYRVPIWQWIIKEFGIDHILTEHLIYSALLFIISLILSVVYYETIKKWCSGIVLDFYKFLAKTYKHFEAHALKG